MAELIPIDDPDDPRVAAYRDVRERDLVGRQGLFVAEGEVVLRVLARSRLCEPVSLLLADKRVGGLTEVIAALPAETPVYAASQAVMDQVVGFPIHRGILGLGRRRATPTAGELLAGLPTEALVLALCGIANHDNMGGLFRNAAAFGADAVILDDTCADPLYRKAIRVSVGAALATPFAPGAGRKPARTFGLARLRGPGPEPAGRGGPGRPRARGAAGGVAGGGGARPSRCSALKDESRPHTDGGRLRFAERGGDRRDRPASPEVRGQG
jgi:hypothetical protein